MTGKEGTHLPLEDLLKPGGGAWNLLGKVQWKKSKLATFQGQPALCVFYGKGSGTSSDPGVGGMSFEACPKGVAGNKCKISFEVYFEKGWHFSKGGKIGGLFIGEGNASGYRHSDTASSHRIMWKKDGAAISYIYPPSNLKQEDADLKASGCGIGYFIDVFPAGTLKVGAWNSVTLGVKMNSFEGGRPNPDGVSYLEVNGKSAKLRNVRWSRSSDLKISKFDFNTFFGGPDPAVKDCIAYFRNFKVLPW